MSVESTRLCLVLIVSRTVVVQPRPTLMEAICITGANSIVQEEHSGTGITVHTTTWLLVQVRSGFKY